MAESPHNIDGLSPELKSFVVQVLEENTQLKAENVALREEVARLKGLKGRPQLKPSGMEKSTEAQAKRKRKPGRRGAKRPKLTIDETKIIKAENIEAGARFKGYEDFIVQDVIVQPRTILYRRERWLLPSGETIVAPLPNGIVGHFGAELKRFIISQYVQGQVTMPRLVRLLNDLGIAISKRQVMRLLIDNQEAFLTEAHDVLRAGLASADWITVDDTGARHQAKNGFCTHIGNDQFASFTTTSSKSRLNFLELLTAGDTTHLINDASIAYMRERNLSGIVIDQLAAHPEKSFANRGAWMAHVEKLGITALKINPDPVRIATEGALWGSITAQGLLNGTVIVSDDAGQFDVGDHALCWIHAERLVHKLDAFTEAQRQAKERIREQIWSLYADLKAYRKKPTQRHKAELTRRFKIFTTQIGFVTLDRLLSRLNAQQDQLLAVLERPDIPLHTNGSENDIRCQVTRRKISGGTRSNIGRDCRDAFLGLMKTCAKQGIRFWDYLGARLGVLGAADVPPLAELVAQPAL
jgi:cell division septum initiation protein DivIVA